jgi:hypothetical protein
MFTFDVGQHHLLKHVYQAEDFILKLEVLLLLRNTLITRLSIEESAFVLAQDGNILYTD